MCGLASDLIEGAGQNSYSEVASEYDKMRRLVTSAGALSSREIALCLLAAFAARRDETGVRACCREVAMIGISQEEAQHVVLLLLGACIGLSPTVDTLKLVKEAFSKQDPEQM